MTDLVVVSLEAWDEVWRRNQHLVAGLLRRDPSLRVLFVEPATDSMHDLLQRRTPQRALGLRAGPRVEGVDDGRLWLFQTAKRLPRRKTTRPHGWKRHLRRTVGARRGVGGCIRFTISTAATTRCSVSHGVAHG